jgi:2,3-diketo-5-methylthio-1-phosphopentane phosphatase
MALRFFIDFDGTITQHDVVDRILERFAESQWQDIEQEWAMGKIGSRECLVRQMELVSAGKKELGALVDQVQVDPFFVSFVKHADALSIPVAIVSDGFDFVIERVLKRVFADCPEFLESVPVFSNRLSWISPTSLRVDFPSPDSCAHGCANCKVKVIKNLSQEDEDIIFIGDGLSDRFAAQSVFLTFAKGKLLKYCSDHRINYRRWWNFNDIDQWMSNVRKETYVTV